MLTGPTTTTGPTRTQVWFGPAARPLYGWLSRPADGVARGAVVLCPPMGEEGRASHRTFRRLAEALAGAGLLALRLDYDGTGDSAGLQDDPDRVASWLASVEAGRQYLLGLGASSVSAVGMRLGATLAAVQASRGGPFDMLVAWDPCLSGRTFLREGEALYLLGEESPGAAPDDGYRHTPGFQYDAATARDLKGLDVARIPADAVLATRTLLLTRTDRPAPAAVAQRLSAGTVFEQAPAVAQDRLLDLPPSDCFVPEEALALVVDRLAAHVADRPAVPVAVPAARPGAEPLDERGGVVLASAGEGSAPVRERSVWLGPTGIYGVVTEPVDHPDATTDGPRPWVVLVNVAAEHHIGPGRRWVEWARTWAALGYRVVRIDQSGIGDSPTRPGQLEDTAFAPEWLEDMREVVRELRADGARLALAGLCSGSYSAFEAAMWEDVDAVFAANPRLTLFPAARNTPVWTPLRRAAQVPAKPFAVLSEKHRDLAGGLWRIYRQLAVWHAPLLVLRRVLRRGTAVSVVAYPKDARHFYEVVALAPLLWLMRRDPRFSFVEHPALDHSLLGRPGQLEVHARATAFLTAAVPPPGGTRRSRRGRDAGRPTAGSLR